MDAFQPTDTRPTPTTGGYTCQTREMHPFALRLSPVQTEIVKYLAKAEHRSCNQQVAQLIHEALVARQRKAAHTPREGS